MNDPNAIDAPEFAAGSKAGVGVGQAAALQIVDKQFDVVLDLAGQSLLAPPARDELGHT
jgi:hypothetical protein